MPHELERLNRNEIFVDTDTPLLAVDGSLVIRAANPRYLETTGRDRDQLIGTPLFEAFPANPEDPHATGVANASASFQEVFRHNRRQRLALQRYDIHAPESDMRFVRRFWTTVNSPLHDARQRVVGALHHVEDVTRVVEPVLAGDGQAQELDPDACARLVDMLRHEITAHEQARVHMSQLERALSSRIVIEQAKGVVRARRQVTTEEAFEALRHWARSSNLRLVDVCVDVVGTLELPPPIVSRR